MLCLYMGTLLSFLKRNKNDKVQYVNIVTINNEKCLLDAPVLTSMSSPTSEIPLLILCK